MNLNDLPIGTEIFNHGDMANVPQFGKITKHYSDRWGDSVEIEYEDGTINHRIHVCEFDAIYSGNGSTRFVTKAAYAEYQEKLMASYIERYAK
jgi:Mg-chelatase subunit ChlI